MGAAIREQSENCYIHDINYKLCYNCMHDYVDDDFKWVELIMQ